MPPCFQYQPQSQKFRLLTKTADERHPFIIPASEFPRLGEVAEETGFQNEYHSCVQLFKGSGREKARVTMADEAIAALVSTEVTKSAAAAPMETVGTILQRLATCDRSMLAPLTPPGGV